MEHPKKILEGLQIFPKKSFSQNFFVSKDHSQKLVGAFLKSFKGDEIWEIGPGLGALTETILESTDKPLVLFEKDERLFSHLSSHFPNATLVRGDFLEQNLKERAAKKKVGVISNLPYQISTAVLFALIEERPALDTILFMFQKEVAQRLRAPIRTKPYAAISVLLQLLFEIRSEGIFPPHCFFPNPQIDSEALSFHPREREFSDFDSLKTMIQKSFQQRRKKLLNNLPDVEKTLLIDFLTKRGLTESARAEELTPEQFYELFSILSK